MGNLAVTRIQRFNQKSQISAETLRRGKRAGKKKEKDSTITLHIFLRAAMPEMALRRGGGTLCVFSLRLFFPERVSGRPGRAVKDARFLRFLGAESRGRTHAP